mmetsp:Transcript_43969/g.144127  ORF Transcript_43969/g.144127 Transcript_43969/m.144127 type:complete len:186 (-) Transcript_43969:326-883(-)
MSGLVLILLAIACGASWPTAASGKGARGAASSATVCLAVATVCLTGVAAAPVGFFASAFSWLAMGPPKVAAARHPGRRRQGDVAPQLKCPPPRLFHSLLGVLLCLATVAGGFCRWRRRACRILNDRALHHSCLPRRRRLQLAAVRDGWRPRREEQLEIRRLARACRTSLPPSHAVSDSPPAVQLA